MNQANQVSLNKTAVNILNAEILMLKLKGEKFNMQKEQVWQREQILIQRAWNI
jgi:hypothetical protein